jgi:single-stranded-DNA-specific exonuclease
VDIGAAIAACSRLLLSHGGHPGAAGVSLLPENIAAFRRELSRQIPLYRDETVQVGVTIDAVVSLADLSLDLAAELARLAPFGQGNPTPQLVSYDLAVLGDRRMGREGTHRKLSVRAREGAGPSYDVIWFHGADAELPVGPLDLVYTIGINEFQGRRDLQLMYVASRPAAPAVVTVTGAEPSRIRLRVHDLRRSEVDPRQLPPPHAALWYAEGGLLREDDTPVAYSSRAALTAPRTELRAPQPFVLWSAPPSSGLLSWLLETAQPSELYLLARTTADDTISGTLRHIGGMIKFALRHDGHVPLAQAAARIGVTEALVRHALFWFEAKGHIRLLEWLPEDVAHIAPGDGAADPAAESDHLAEVEAQLAEIRAYRRFVQRATLQELDIQAAP